MAEQTAMLTARIPQATKDLVAEYLDRAGYTPSQAIQVVWKHFAKRGYKETAAAMHSMDDDRDAAKRQRLDAFKRSQKLRMSQEYFKELFGTEQGPDYTPASDDEMAEERMDYLWDKFTEGAM